ncbi:hypothetical protein M3G03_04205 [Aestuariimicrobium sp. p3-SID1156]|uniref:inositol monophosphatase family protein n=1 Tax=Aestuariimicrobium sp. p3-SID1156 TaxID=2916038 RepID=UPI00223B079F|nr:inositol monophosphatase family protein [Aestuariimicrobium sp. p3-SID1156]MCT1458749.1 hypothetical protein [Aestuariimicrobium sp. p3-SID1156]
MSANAGVPEPTTAVRVIAHRGDSEAARENTLAAVAAAVEAQATGIEIDVRTSADGVGMVIHDPTTLRLWGRAEPVAAQTAASLQGLGTAGGRGTRIPTLTQVLDLLAEQETPPRLVIDSVTEQDAITGWTEARRHPAVKDARLQVEWSGTTEAVRAIRELDDRAIIQGGHEGGEFDAALWHQLGARLINIEFCQLTPSLIEQVHAAGFEVGTWTVNSAEEMSWAIDAGVDAITTDRPRLLHALATKGYSPLAMAWADPAQLAARLGLGEDLGRWLWVARDLADWAIHYTRTARLGDIESKAHGADVVTAVDKAVEEHVRAVIAAEFPDHVVVGEEFGGEAVEGRPTWYLDPVDGTTNLANTLPWTSMSLALAIDGQPVVAVVAQPWTEEVYLAARGLGATLNGRPLELGGVTSLEGKVFLTELAAHEFWDGQVEFMERLGESFCTSRVMGSGTLTMARVASGDAAGGLVHHFHPIDHLAGVLIAHEAGARVLNEDGDDNLFPSGGGMMVCAPGVAEKLWRIWKPEMQQY